MSGDRLIEADIERPATEYARRRGWFVAKIQFLDKNAAPDHLYARFRNGVKRQIWIEFKKPGETPTRQQLRRHAEMRAAGMDVRWTDSLEQAKEWLR